ncbi:MAG TPA: glycerophosphodiester phosphodiesterase family protein [Anaerolineae bacterium]|nr:glycerophosphodiester phosphodiesterase family protein [Anaerolineae bacterium]
MSFYLDRPLNLAHKGASHEAPGNTLAAFLLARELGADGVELDVQLSRDGTPVVIHDATVEATTDGHGRVRAMTLAELKALDAGSWFDPVYAGQRIPTLQEVVDALGPGLLINIELKTVSGKDDGLASAVVRLVEENHLLDRVVISSFNPLALWRVRRLNPWIPVGMLYCDGLPFFLSRPWLRHLVRPEALHPDWTLVDDGLVRWARKRGYRVHTWTVDDPGKMWQLVEAGVDLIITNRPDLLRQVLEAGPAPGEAPVPGREGK